MAAVDFYNDVFLKMSEQAQANLLRSYREDMFSYYAYQTDVGGKWRADVITFNTATPEELISWHDEMLANQSMSKVTSLDGSRVLGYDYNVTVPHAENTSSFAQSADALNSNLSGGSYGGTATGVNVQERVGPFNADFVSNKSAESGGGYSSSMGIKEVSSGNTLAAIADKASLAFIGTRLGTKLGMGFDSLLYSIAPDWWDANFPTINPETWGQLATAGPFGKAAMRILFGIDGDAQPKSYVSADALAYTYMMLRDLGAFGGDDETVETTPDGFPSTGRITTPFISHAGNSFTVLYNDGTQQVFSASDSNATNYAIFKAPNNNRAIILWARSGGVWNFDGKYVAGQITDTTAIYFQNVSAMPTYNEGEGYAADAKRYSNPISWLIVYGATAHSSVDGAAPLPSSQAPNGIPSPSVVTGPTVADVLSQLQQNYPYLFDGAVTTSTLQDDGTTREDLYVPIDNRDPSTGLLDDQVVTPDGASQTSTQTTPETFFRQTQRTTNKNPDDTGTGNQSPFVAPTGNASSLWAVYHPSQAQLNAFGAWLWSSDFVEQLKRLFNDPMQAIIGVHKVFAPIPTGGSQNIKCGYLDSGVSAPVVSSQYTEVACGTVNCREYFGNVFDYDPHTRVSIYLPFIGVVPLKVSEVMRASITVTYGVDVITGACLAKVKVDRDGGGAILYSFGGSCACHYPISAGSYAGIISGIVTSAVGVAGGIMSGNPLAAVGGVLAGARQAHTEVQHSGGFTGCAGAMGPKIPYLIITRPQTRVANDVQLYEGKPSNATQFIGDCTGFVRATEVHFSSQAAFDDEVKEVEALLKSGVLISD